MSIKYIFNGYYRSGTTLIWNILKKSNEEFIVFYEPLHPDLIKEIKKITRDPDKKNELHNKQLWSDYLAINQNFINDLENNSYNKILPDSFEEINNFLKVFDSLNQNVILQTNRLHYYLNRIQENYNLEVIYIIRNPVSVYNSLMRIYQKNDSIKKSIIRYLSFLKNGYTPKSKVFHTDYNIDYIYHKYNLPVFWGDSNFKKKVLKDPLKAHFISWTLSNFIGLKEGIIKNENIIVYENLLNYPNEVKNRIESNFNLSFDISMVKNKNSSIDVYKQSKILNLAEELKVKKEYLFILEKINLL